MVREVDERILRLARRLHRKNNLKFPVPVEDLVRSYADLKFIDMPFDIDGLCMDLKAIGTRTKVFVKKGGYRTRQRFTLAHELGHILIPWHTGNIIDHTDLNGDIDLLYWFMEGEANAFASELLMPEDCVRNYIKEYHDIRELIEGVAEDLDVSIPAAIFRIFRFMPKNNIIGFSYSEHDDKRYVVRSPGTKVRISDSSLFDDEELDSFHNGEVFNFNIGPYCIRYATFPNHLDLPEIYDPRDWREILIECLSCFYDDIKSPRQRINGLISVVNSDLRSSVDERELYAQFIHRISGHAEFSMLLEKDIFHQFAAKRIKEFIEKKI
ncbi:uncharacterized protein DUF955 [Nitrospirillum amazonense]|uniref:Uncharacterized protein DUF955 n=1 Tax=Nitrospirillum amazonense TaxID=28077 RepID=A0A560FPL3_9PROT|nr:ImmA/IrrE family metallo-endopeptidase [Nitrospirillum amazonense]TWB23564.1 uncharacterized protein DUF955 [Nitrospirillum amazonense]